MNEKRARNTLGSNLTRCRTRLGMEISELATLSNVGGLIIENIEEGNIDIHLEDLSHIADSLGVSVSDLSAGIPRTMFEDFMLELVINNECIETKKGKYLFSKNNGNGEVIVRYLTGDRLPEGALVNMLRRVIESKSYPTNVKNR